MIKIYSISLRPRVYGKTIRFTINDCFKQTKVRVLRQTALNSACQSTKQVPALLDFVANVKMGTITAKLTTAV